MNRWRGTLIALAALCLAHAATAQTAPLGDVDGDGYLGAGDVLLVQRWLQNGQALTPQQAAAANVVVDYANGAPLVDVRDLAVLMRRIGCQPAVCKEGGSANVPDCSYQPTYKSGPPPVGEAPLYGVCAGPRVLVDSGHFALHQIDRSFSGFAKLLIADGYDVRSVRWTKPFNGLPLTSFGDVLVIVTPRAEDPNSPNSPAFDPESHEANGIANWVAAGGSLLLIADHAPYNHVKDLVNLFGLSVTSDSYQIPGDGVSVEDGSINTTGDVALALSEGVETIRILDTVAFSPTGNPPPGITQIPILVGKSPVPNGAWIGVAITSGAGRAYISGDAAQFTAQFQPGLNATDADNQRFVRNILHWLDGSLSLR
ncbi:MAG TPA: hypothetical protein VMW19_08600 [Myxococcota bacterium]|nr:hypothetical protein [Myxococcota bacterium]